MAIIAGAMLVALAAFFVLSADSETPPAMPAAPAKTPVRQPPRKRVHAGDGAASASAPPKPGDSETTAPSPPPPPPEPTDVHRLVFGHVVDDDGKPVAWAQVAYASIDAHDDFTWKWSTTADDGKFGIDFGDAFKFRGQRLEVRAGAKGFRTWRGAPVEGDMTIRLERADLLAVPGRVTGLATDPDGRPITGVIEISAMDELFAVHKQLVLADGGGSFVMDGVAPGGWQLFLNWDDAWQDVTVPEGGEAHVELRTSVPTPVLTAWTTDSPKDRQLLEDSVVRFGSTLSDLRLAGKPADDVAAMVAESRVHLAGFNAAWRASLAGREVLVTGLSATGVAIVSAQGVNGTWRVQVRDGAARFPWVAVGACTLVLERPGQRDAEQRIDVVSGDGPQTIERPFAFAVRLR